MAPGPQPMEIPAKLRAVIQEQVDRVCLLAMETQRESPDATSLESLRQSLNIVREAAFEAGARPLVEASWLLEQALELARVGSSGPDQYLGHFVTSLAADLSRVVHAGFAGTDPEPILQHARETLRSMPRRGTDFLVELDLTDPDQVARIFAAMGDHGAEAENQVDDLPSSAPPISGTDQLVRAQQPNRTRELRRLLASYVTQAEMLRAGADRVEILDDLLLSIKAVRASAAGADVRLVERLAARVGYVAETLRSRGIRPTPEIVQFFIGSGRAIVAMVDAPEVREPVIQRVEEFVKQSSAILRSLQVDTSDLGTLALPVIPSPNAAVRRGRLPGDLPRSAGDGGPRKTLYEALKVLEAAYPSDRGAPKSAPHPNRNRTDPSNFMAEISDLVTWLPGVVEAFERDPDANVARGEIGKAIGDLKESAAVVGAVSIVERCWRVEGALRAAPGSRDPHVVDDLWELVGELEWLLAEVEPARPPVSQGGPHRSVAVDVEALSRVTALVGELGVRTGGYTQRTRRMGLALQDLLVIVDRLRTLSRGLEQGAEASNLAQEFGEIASDIAIAAGDLDQIRFEFESVGERSGLVIGRLENAIHGLRLTPIATLVPTLERAIRGMAPRLGKQVRLVVEGGETMVSNDLLDKLTDSLLHVVRNAVDHGIELPAGRDAAGKPRQGTISLRAHRDGSQTVVQIADDGVGIDHHQVLKRAREIGYPIPTQGMTPERVLQLIFFPGVTTRSGAANRQTAGHGLDVVSTSVAEMKGSVSVESEPGRGSTITFRLPLEIKRLPAVVVGVAGQHYAIPFERVEVIPREAVRAIRWEGTSFLADLGSSTIPAADLGALLGLRLPHHVQDAGGALMRLQYGGNQWLLRIDKLVGQQDIELQPAVRPSLQSPGVVACATLASGGTATVLDIAQVFDARRNPRRRRTRQTATLGAIQFALIADESASARRALGQMLERYGWRAIEARDGLEAWEMLESTQPDLLIVDLDLPLLDAAQVVRAAKAQREVPVIALTSNSENEVQAQIMSLGVDALLTKPVNEEHLEVSLDLIERSCPLHPPAF